MARNIEKDAKEMAERREKILETGFRLFAERTIEKVTMNDIAKEAGIGVATLYRYYSTKPLLVTAISVRIWQNFIDESIKRVDNMQCTALQEFEGFLEAFLELYREHKDILRFNQFFNVYVQSEDIQEEEMIRPYNDMIRGLYERFCGIISKAEKDKTMRTDISTEEIFSTALHLMLAATTRYAVGLVYNDGTEHIRELVTLKNMMLETYGCKI